MIYCCKEMHCKNEIPWVKIKDYIMDLVSCILFFLLQYASHFLLPKYLNHLYSVVKNYLPPS